MPSLKTDVLPLESGDHLTRDEFHRRYCAHPEIKNAELVEGVVYVPSPLRVRRHGTPHARIMTWLGVFRTYTPEVELVDNATVKLDERNELQPDASLFREEPKGPRVSAEDYLD